MLQISSEGEFTVLGLSLGAAAGTSLAECGTHLAHHRQALDPKMRELLCSTH